MQGLLIILLVIGSISTIGCGKKKKPSQQAMINACLFDPTGNCARQAAAMAQAGAPAVLPYIQQVGQNSNGPLVAGVLPPTQGGARPGAGIKVSAVSNADLASHRARVRSALDADSADPRSLHFDPPTVVPQRRQSDIAAARALTTQNDQLGLSNAGNRSPASAEEAGVR